MKGFLYGIYLLYMAKNIENDPMVLQEDHMEEEVRLYGKDKAHNYIPVEQIPDTEGLEIDGSEEENEAVEESDEEKIEKIQKEIKFGHYAEGNVASVGPDALEGNLEVNKDGVLVEENLEKDTQIIPRRKINAPIRSMGVSQVTRESASHMSNKSSNAKRNNPNPRLGYDNLKTMSEKKKERGLRGFLRKMLGK